MSNSETYTNLLVPGRQEVRAASLVVGIEIVADQKLRQGGHVEVHLSAAHSSVE